MQTFAAKCQVNPLFNLQEHMFKLWYQFQHTKKFIADNNWRKLGPIFSNLITICTAIIAMKEICTSNRIVGVLHTLVHRRN
jgi:hypothetical protein